MRDVISWLLLLGVASGCGNGSTTPSADGGVGPVGTWRLQRETTTTTLDDGGVTTQTINDTDTALAGGGTGRVNGALELTTNEYAVGVTHMVGGLVDPSAEANALADTYAPLTPGASAFSLTHHPPVGFQWQQSPTPLLTLQTDARRSLVFAPRTPAPADTMPISGKIRLNSVSMDNPHVALLFFIHGAPFSVTVDPRDDKALPPTSTWGGETFSIDGLLDRTDAPIGTERIVWGSTAEMAMGVVIVYDRIIADDAGVRPFDVAAYVNNTCTTDCVRGVSKTVLAYRLGSSPQFLASAYRHLGEKWTQAQRIADESHPGKEGLISLDQAHPVTFDVDVPTNAMQIAYPVFDLSQ
jgi:hypothetical protein